MKHLAFCCGSALLAAASPTLAQTGPAAEQAPVLSSTPIVEAGRTVGYSVQYSHGGQRYTTRTDQPPGATLPVQVTPLGVATYPVEPRQDLPTTSIAPTAPGTAAAGAMGEPPWAQVAPQPGVVVSHGQPQGVAPLPAPAIAPPAYAVYGAPVVVYPQPYGYGYPYAAGWAYPRAYPRVYYPRAYYPRAYPPVNLSFSLGYSRGWHPRPYRWR